MSIVQAVGNISSSSVTSLDTTINSTGAGNLLTISVICTLGSPTVTVSDNKGNTWAQVYTPTNTNFQTQYTANAASGVTTVTVTMSVADRPALIIIERDNSPASPIDQTTVDKGAGSGTALTSNTTGTTVQALEWGLGVFAELSNGTNTFTPGTGWTAVSGTGITNGYVQNASGGGVIFCETQDLTTTQTLQASATQSTSVAWDANVMTFKRNADVTLNAQCCF